jgi:predicted enzyme related to lactoylglutathione lyase
VGTVAGVWLAFSPVGDELEAVVVAPLQGVAERVPTGAPMALPKRAPGEDPFTPEPASVRGIPAYPNGKPRRMVAPPTIQGVPMALSWFETTDAVEAVVAYYDEYFRLLKIHHTSHLFSEGAGYSAWLEHDDDPDAGLGEGVLHMVSAVRQGQKTVVFLSATNPMAVLQANAPQLPPGVVLPPGSSAPSVFELGEARGARLTVHASVREGTVESVGAFYETVFREAGWTITEHTAEAGRAQITARRGGELQTVSLAHDGQRFDLLLDFVRDRG